MAHESGILHERGGVDWQVNADIPGQRLWRLAYRARDVAIDERLGLLPPHVFEQHVAVLEMSSFRAAYGCVKRMDRVGAIHQLEDRLKCDADVPRFLQRREQ